jgi:gas vesicle protein
MTARSRPEHGVQRGAFLKGVVIPGLVASVPGLLFGAPGQASARYTNIEEAREKGDQLREEQEKVGNSTVMCV